MFEFVGQLEAYENEKSRYWPFIQADCAIITICFLYIAMCIFGPKYMANKKPKELKNAMFLYNAFQVILSAWMVYLAIDGIKYFLQFKNSFDHIEKVSDYKWNPLWWYFIAKFTELLDTVFMIIRKKNSQITFLHVYHHSVMILYTWLVVRYSPGDQSVIGTMVNSFVHVIMYSYYFLAALGPNIQKYLWWKRYITVIQLAQFGTMSVWYVIVLLTDRSGTHYLTAFNFVFMLIFAALFGNFYAQSYKKMKTV